MGWQTEYENYRKRIDNFLESEITNTSYPEQVVVDAMKYSLLSGGKRVRGVLVLAFNDLIGGDIFKALPVAAAIEMIHCYSLIHDDLPCMDDDDLRRGKPSCHIMFGQATALLAGDALLTYAFETIAKSTLSDGGKVKSIQLLSNASGFRGMIGGQALDLDSEGKQISVETLNKMHTMKTGALIKASCSLGEISAGNQFVNDSIAENFGEKLGLAFQIRDDILDVIGKEESIGKPIGSDSLNEKSTYTTLLGLKEAEKICTDLSIDCKKMVQNKYKEKSSFLCAFTDYLLKREN